MTGILCVWTVSRFLSATSPSRWTSSQVWADSLFHRPPDQATASGDQSVRLTDVESRKTIATFQGHTCSVKQVAFDPHNPSKGRRHERRYRARQAELLFDDCD